MKVKLKDKNFPEIEIDLNRVSVLDLRAILEKGTPEDKADEVLARAMAITKEELQALGFRDYRKVARAFWSCVRDPLKDEDDEKNSQSEFTSG